MFYGGEGGMSNSALGNGFKRMVMVCTAIILMYDHNVMATENNPNNVELMKIQKGAEAGYPAMQFYLADHYRNKPQPTSEDTKNMMYWYEEAAKQGHAPAHSMLAYFFSGKLGIDYTKVNNPKYKEYVKRHIENLEKHQVPIDYVKAYAHYLLAENMKSGYGGSRKVLAKNMTQEQVEDAKNAAKNWEQQYYHKGE